MVSSVATPAVSDPFLVPFGWGEAVATRWTQAATDAVATDRCHPHTPPEAILAGRVVRTSRRFTYVAITDHVVRVTAPLELSPAPVTGDWVVMCDRGDGGEPVIVAVAERHTELSRSDPSSASQQQVLAANVDLVIAVFGLDRELKPGRLERSLVLAHDSGAEPVVVLTKADTCDNPHAIAAEVAKLAGDVEVHVVSSVTGRGTVELAGRLQPNRTAVLLGESGAGKSTLVNHLAGREVQRTAEVRTSDAKGRHTTVTRDLIVLDNGGVVIDTPGLRALGLIGATDGVAATFDDVESLTDGCRFRECAHRSEPGCAVIAAVADGTLDAGRLERYLAFTTELADADTAVTEEARRPRGRPSPPPTT